MFFNQCQVGQNLRLTSKLRIHFSKLLEDENEKLNNTPLFTVPLKNSKNKPIDHTDNWRALFNYYGTQISYNEISKDVVVKFAPDRAPKDTSGVLITAHNDNKNVVIRHIKNDATINNLSITTCEDHISVVAKENRHHPVKQWIEQQVWDGKSRLKDFVNIFKLVDEDDYDVVYKYCTKWLIQAVAALYRPDFVTQGVLSLLGGQGIKKSTFLRSIIPNTEWVGTGLTVDPHNKDDVIRAIHYWIIELGEIDAMFRKTDIAAIKNWITQDYDELRLPYDKQPVKYKRQTVSIATVNEADYLNDEENRRWWVVHILSININHGINLGQLWAEAKSLYEAGVPYWLSDTEMIDVNERNLRYCRQSSVTDLLASAEVILPTGKKGENVQRLNCTEILKKIGIDKATNPQRRECAVWLKSRKFKFYSTKAAYDVVIENEVFAKYYQN